VSIEDWNAIVAAAGFDTDGMQQYEIYQLAGRIIHDSFVAGVKREIAPAFSGRLPMGLTASLVGSFSYEQKRLLRERVSK